MNIKGLSILIFLVFICSCKRELSKTGDPNPKIGFQSLSKTILKSFNDSLSIGIHYEDGDGDLGNFNPDTLDLFVRDSRLSKYDGFHLPPLAPQNANVRISGIFYLNLRNIFLFNESSPERMYFEIYVRDRKGHYSNKIKTPDITIIP
jgi:hypothetical protein